MNSLRTLARFLWYKTAVPIFIERYLLPLLATATFVLIILNPMKFDRVQQVTLGVAVLASAYFLAHTLHRHNEASRLSATPAATPASSPQEKPKNIPEFEGEIKVINVGVDAHDPTITGLTLIISIKNLGTPSVAKGWPVSVDIPGKGRINAAPQRLTETHKITLHGVTHAPVVYRGSDALYEKAGATPIPTGGEVTGILVYMLKGVSRDEVMTRGTVITLNFKDVTDREYQIKRTVEGNPTGDLQFFPGLKMDVKPESKKKSKRRK